MSHDVLILARDAADYLPLLQGLELQGVGLDTAETPAGLPDLAIRPDAQPTAWPRFAPSFRTDPCVPIRAPPHARHI